MEQVSVGQLLDRVQDRHEPVVRDRQITLVTEASPDAPIIFGDSKRIEQAVQNLVANAVRHTPATCRIWVRLGPSDGGAILSVEDDGEGVPHDLRHAVFEPFRQGPSASPHSPGTGIGLSLVAKFAELHGGRAWVDERPGGGAAFRVFLPPAPGTGLSGGGEQPSHRADDAASAGAI